LSEINFMYGWMDIMHMNSDYDNEEKKARNSSPFSDRYLVLSAKDSSSFSSVSPFLLNNYKVIKLQVGSVAEI